MLASTVSSKILDTIAKKEGIKFEDTLTGFKWMGSRSKKLIDQGNNVIFAFEEAIGFMYGSNVLDKVGILKFWQFLKKSFWLFTLIFQKS